MVFNFLCFRYYKSCFVNFFLCVFYSHVHTRYYETSISKSLKINGGAHVCFVSGIPCVQIDFACITKPFSLIPCNGCFKTSSKISMENIGSYHSAFLDLGNANDLFIYNPIWTFFERVILILKPCDKQDTNCVNLILIQIFSKIVFYWIHCIWCSPLVCETLYPILFGSIVTSKDNIWISIEQSSI